MRQYARRRSWRASFCLIGEGEARAALDSVRAARQMAELTLDMRTVVWGHLQGGHAALWPALLDHVTHQTLRSWIIADQTRTRVENMGVDSKSVDRVWRRTFSLLICQ